MMGGGGEAGTGLENKFKGRCPELLYKQTCVTFLLCPNSNQNKPKTRRTPQGDRF